MDEYQKSLLEQVAGLHEVPAGAYNIRANGQAAGRAYTYRSPVEVKPGDKVELPGGTHAVVVDEPIDAAWIQVYGADKIQEIVGKAEEK